MREAPLCLPVLRTGLTRLASGNAAPAASTLADLDMCGAHGLLGFVLFLTNYASTLRIFPVKAWKQGVFAPI